MEKPRIKSCGDNKLKITIPDTLISTGLNEVTSPTKDLFVDSTLLDCKNRLKDILPLKSLNPFEGDDSYLDKIGKFCTPIWQYIVRHPVSSF